MSRFIIDSWFPIQGIHLVAGPSGVGKSRWLLKVIESWQKGESVFGHISHPAPFVYIVADRGRRDAFATMYQMRMNPKTWPLIAHDDVPQIETALQIIKRARKYFPLAKVFIIEGIASLVPGGGDKANSNGSVQKFLKELSQFNKQTDSTIIGTVHTSKVKKDSEYEITREKIMGASAWGGYSNTIIALAQGDPKNPLDQTRRVTILPRNAKVEQYSLVFNDSGLLERVADAPKTDESALSRHMKAFLAALSEDQQEFTTKDVETFFAALDPPQTDRSARRALLKSGLVEKVGKGRYQKKVFDALDLALNPDASDDSEEIPE